MGKPHSTLYGIPVKELARICKVDLSTARKWKRGARVPPKSALMLLSGDLGCLDREWSGWVVRNGSLISPEGWEVTVSDVLASPLLRSQLAVYQAENRTLRGLAQQYEEDQPVPAQIPQIKG